jgi:hypothetical protein
MIRSLAIIFFLGLLSSCDFAHFDKTPQNRLNEIPPQFHGDYYLIEDPKKSKENIKDTAFIHIDSKGYSYTGKKGPEFHSLKDSLVLALSGGQYFLCWLEDDHTWSLNLVEKKKENIVLYNILRKDFQGNDRLDKYFKSVKQHMPETNDTLTVYLMDEAKLSAFVKKKKNLHAIVLKKYTP